MAVSIKQHKSDEDSCQHIFYPILVLHNFQFLSQSHTYVNMYISIYIYKFYIQNIYDLN